MFYCGHFRFLILFMTFFASVCQVLVIRNLVFALPAMLDLTREFQKNLHNVSDADTCIQGTNARELLEIKNQKGGPFKWSADELTTLLGVAPVGMVIGTVLALFVYDYCFTRPIFSVSLLWAGLLNLFAPEIAYRGRAAGIMISRLAIGK